MKHEFKTPQPFVVAVLLTFVIIGSSWQPQTKSGDSTKTNYTGNRDTSEPHLQHNDAKDFDMKHFDEGMKEFDKAMAHLDIEIKKIDFSEINKEVNEALSKIDFNRISQDVNESLKKIDWDKIKVDVDKSLQQAKEQLAQVNTEKINEKLKEVQGKLNSEEFRSQFNAQKMQEKIEEGMKNAQKDLDKTKETLLNYKALTNALQNDGLIDKKKGFSIQLKNGELFINGVKQSKETTEKYRKYYQGKNDFNIEINQNDKEENGDDNDSK